MAVGGDLFVVFSIPRGRAMPDTTTTAYGGHGTADTRFCLMLIALLRRVSRCGAI